MNSDENNKEGVDLSGALKDSGEKLQGEWRRSARPLYSEAPALTIIQWIIKHSNGLVKDKKQASYVLIGLVALAIIISLILLFGGGGTAGRPEDIKILPAEF